MKKKRKSKKKRKIINIYNILLACLILIALILVIFIIVINNKNSEVVDKIAKLDSITNEIVLLRDNYDTLSEIDKKIGDISNKNNLINKDIDNLTNSIKDYEGKISKYRK